VVLLRSLTPQRNSYALVGAVQVEPANAAPCPGGELPMGMSALPARPTCGGVDGEQYLRRGEGDPGVAERLRGPEIADGLHGPAGQLLVRHDVTAISTTRHAPSSARATIVMRSLAWGSGSGWELILGAMTRT
jgi:hypothetical protein